MKKVFLSLGANLGCAKSNVEAALRQLKGIKEIFELNYSSLYETSPVSPIPQKSFVNAVCCFQTTLNANDLFIKLQGIERKLGKRPKPKDAPRAIDIDILFFGEECYNLPELKIPHPFWKERLFVLQPLLDLIEEITVVEEGAIVKKNIRTMINCFPYLDQKVKVLEHEKS